MGPDRRLTSAQEARITDEVGQGRFRHIDDVRYWVQDTFGITYSYWGMRSVLDRLHIHPKVPRPQVASADPPAKRRGKGGLTDAVQALGVSATALVTFADELRVGLMGIVRRVLPPAG